MIERLYINQLAKEVHDLAVSKGWWEGDRPLGDQVSNFHAEVSEAWEEYRRGEPLKKVYFVDGKPEGFPVELADLIIRVLDTCAAYEINIEDAIYLKHEYNKSREYRHGGKLA